MVLVEVLLPGPLHLPDAHLGEVHVHPLGGELGLVVGGEEARLGRRLRAGRYAHGVLLEDRPGLGRDLVEIQEGPEELLRPRLLRPLEPLPGVDEDLQLAGEVSNEVRPLTHRFLAHRRGTLPENPAGGRCSERLADFDPSRFFR